MAIKLSGSKIRLRGLTLALTSAVPGAATAITLNDISSNGYIHQRVGTSKDLTISGTYSGTPSAIQARAVPAGTAITSNAYAWSTIATLPTGGTYSGTLNVPQGGWYVLQVRDSVNANVNAGGSNKFGVGIRVLLMGQSNMRNLSQIDTVYPNTDELTRRYGGNGFKYVGNYHASFAPNVPFATYGAGYDGSAAVTTGESVGSGRGDGVVYLANYLRSNLNIPVLVMEYGVAGSSIATWQPTTGANFNALVAALNAIGGDAEAAIWLQGEENANAGTSSASWQSSLGNILTGIRSQTGRNPSSFKFGVATLGTTVSYGPEGSFGTIRSAQLDFVAANTANGVFYAATAIDASTSDGVHIVGTGQARLGKRYAQAILKELGAVSIGMRGPVISSATRSGAVVTVDISQDGGTALLDGAGGSGSALLGFRVFDNGVAATISSTAISGNTVVLTLSATPAGTVTMDYGMANAPFTNSVSAASVLYDNATVIGDTLGRPLQPKALMAVT